MRFRIERARLAIVLLAAVPGCGARDVVPASDAGRGAETRVLVADGSLVPPDGAGVDDAPAIDVIPNDIGVDAADVTVLDTGSDGGDTAPDGACMQGATGLPPRDPACPAGSWSCEGRCVRLDSDPANCGGCGIRCCLPWCIGGVCGAEGPSGYSVCGGGCRSDCVGNYFVTNTAVDPMNCGACGIVCNEGQTCREGTCVSR
jgi:hypothetical protein